MHNDQKDFPLVNASIQRKVCMGSHVIDTILKGLSESDDFQKEARPILIKPYGMEHTLPISNYAA